MFSDLLWSCIIFVLLIFGLRNSYIALCGVIFVDVLRPQSLSFSFLAGQPISLVMTLLLIVSLILNYKQNSLPQKLWPIFLIILFMIWITITSNHAFFPVYAWYKYDYVIKTILFSLFIPFVINSRIKFDTFIAILITAISFYTMALGLKTIVGGGGYNHALFSANASNTGMLESSNMAMVAVMNIPFLFYLGNHSVFKDEIKLMSFFSKFLIFSSLMSVIGTFARTGLIGLGVYTGLFLSRTRQKWRYILLVIFFLVLGFIFLPQEWFDRMSTINSASEDSSAYGRVVVWRWTLDFVAQNPIYGGGFESYLANAGQLSQYIESDIHISHMEIGKAYHNIYFEVLGEHGYPGLIIFLSIILYTFKVTRKFRKKTKQLNNAEWTQHAATAIHDSLVVYCVCGMFIGVAYYPWLYYYMALSSCLYYGVKTRKEIF